MTKRPILFSADMVRALLAGTKTQTRRVVKPAPHHAYGGQLYGPHDGSAEPDGAASGYPVLRCPYGQPGDRLWVREAWAGSVATVVASADPSDVGSQRGMAAYRATYASNGCPFGKWRPSIHMPRWASRITLEITGVRVQRLQEISEEDAKAEGLSFVADGCARFGVEGLASSWCDCPMTAYAALWESINGPGSWDANPWVWAIIFRRIAP